MKKNNENELMMNEISVKSLQEISGGATISTAIAPLTGLIKPTAGIISRPQLTNGIISKPLLTNGIISKSILVKNVIKL